MFDSSERFLRFCDAFQHLTNSQSLQDLFALYCKGPAPGYFLEFGIANGTRLSNTLLLELLGWQGLGGEPNPVQREQALQRRSIPVASEALYSTSGEVLRFTCNGLYGGLDQGGERRVKDVRSDYTETIEVPTITLGDLLDREKAPKVIDYFSLDIEGAEKMIVRNLPLERYRFGCLTVEHNFTASRRKICRLMERQGFRRVFRDLSGHDDWYVNPSMHFKGWPRLLLQQLDNLHGRMHLARCQDRKLRDRDRAIATLFSLLYSRPRPHPRCYLDLSALLLKAERADEARDVLVKGRVLHPENASLTERLRELDG